MRPDHDETGHASTSADTANEEESHYAHSDLAGHPDDPEWVLLPRRYVVGLELTWETPAEANGDRRRMLDASVTTMIPPSTAARGAPARLPLMDRHLPYDTGPTVVHKQTAEHAAQAALSVLTYLGTARGRAFAGDRCVHELQEKMVELAGDVAKDALGSIMPFGLDPRDRILREVDGQWRIDDRTPAELDDLADQGGYYYEYHLPSRIVGGLYFECTCSACPEQYNVWRIDDSRCDDNTRWGYVRIRSARLKVEVPLLDSEAVIDDAVIVYARTDGHLFGDGGADLKDEETRVRTLEECAKAIHAWWRTRTITDETTLSQLVDGYTSNRALLSASHRRATRTGGPRSTRDAGTRIAAVVANLPAGLVLATHQAPDRSARSPEDAGYRRLPVSHVFPARAGMNPVDAILSPMPHRVFPARAGTNRDGGTSTPIPLDVFPARAGMNRPRGFGVPDTPCVPRPRGDEPNRTRGSTATARGRVPRPRGDEPHVSS